MGSKITPNYHVPTNLGYGHVYRFMSRTRQGIYHYVMVFDTDSVTTIVCSCEGYQYQGVCWHVDEIKARLCLP